MTEGFIIWPFLITIGSIVLIVTIVLVPIQVRYLKGIKEEMERKNTTQDAYYDQMPFQEELLHANTQLHPFFIPANFIAWLWLKMRKEL